MGHRKAPLFVKVITTDKQIVCINPQQLSSFQILKDAQLQRPKPGIVGNPKSAEDLESYTADVIRFYFPSGTGISYEVGKDITNADFNYIVAALQEWVYLVADEFEAVNRAKEQAAIQEWNDTMAQPEVDAVENT